MCPQAMTRPLSTRHTGCPVGQATEAIGMWGGYAGCCVWSSDGAAARRSLGLVLGSRYHASLPAFALLTVAAVWRAFETVAEALRRTRGRARGTSYAVKMDIALYELCRNGLADGSVFNGFGEAPRAGGIGWQSVAANTRVCTFDRGRGEGWSGAHMAGGRSPTRRDLQRCFGRARVPGPFVLAGHSGGGT